MKKAISILLVLVTALSLCACGSASKYVGTYTRTLSNYAINAYEGNHYFNVKVKLTQTITLDSDGTGNVTYVADDIQRLGEDFLVLDCPITWEVVDDYLYISGASDWEDGIHLVGTEGSFSWDNSRYQLEGKSLSPGGGILYTKK